MGYDEKKSLGPKESGAEAALPLWIDFMKVALVGHEKEDFAAPTAAPRNSNSVAQKEDTAVVKAGEEVQAH